MKFQAAHISFNWPLKKAVMVSVTDVNWFATFFFLFLQVIYTHNQYVASVSCVISIFFYFQTKFNISSIAKLQLNYPENLVMLPRELAIFVQKSCFVYWAYWSCTVRGLHLKALPTCSQPQHIGVSSLWNLAYPQKYESLWECTSYYCITIQGGFRTF